MLRVTSREVQGITIVEIRESEQPDCVPLFESVRHLLGERRAAVILDIRGVTRPSSAFCGSLMRIINALDPPVPLIVASEPMKTIFQILPPVGGLPWRLFDGESEALDYVHRRHKKMAPQSE